MLPYAREDDALFDVLRLAKGMTYKSAAADTGLGGGKSVIIGDPTTLKTDALFHSMGRFIDSLDGKYITAEDMNIGIPDLEIVRKETRWVTGLSRESGSSGNPSPYTAIGCPTGCARCSRSWTAARFPRQAHPDPGRGRGRRAAGRALKADGAQVIISDIDEARSRVSRSSTATRPWPMRRTSTSRATSTRPARAART